MLQGYEAHVLEGGRATLLERRIPFIHSELGPVMMGGAGSSAYAFLEAFAQARPGATELELMSCCLVDSTWLFNAANGDPTLLTSGSICASKGKVLMQAMYELHAERRHTPRLLDPAELVAKASDRLNNVCITAARTLGAFQYGTALA